MSACTATGSTRRVPFTEAVATPAHGVLVTSATLTDGTGDALGDWLAAEARTGTRHLERPAWRARVPSPFDYEAQTRIFVVTDVRRDDPGQVAAAYRALSWPRAAARSASSPRSRA